VVVRSLWSINEGQMRLPLCNIACDLPVRVAVGLVSTHPWNGCIRTYTMDGCHYLTCCLLTTLLYSTLLSLLPLHKTCLHTRLGVLVYVAVVVCGRPREH